MFHNRKIIRYLIYICAVFTIPFFGLFTNAEDIRDSAFNLYTGPTLYSDVKGTVTRNDTVTVLNSINTRWSHIRLLDGTVGYCKSHLLQINHEDDAADQARTSCVAKLLSAPDETAAVISVLPADLQLSKGSENENGFVQVTLKTGKTGYLPSSALEDDPLCTAIVLPVPELTAHTGVTTENAVKTRLEELSAYFENGRYWNNFDADSSPINNKSFILSDMPCLHESQGYGHCNFYTSKISAQLGYSYGSQCAGYVGLISDLIFGTEAPITVHTDFESLRPGDHIRLVLWDHSMLVTDVGTDENGEFYVIVTEVNGDYDTCRIDWGRKFTQRDLRRLGDHIEVHTRYPQP